MFSLIHLDSISRQRTLQGMLLGMRHCNLDPEGTHLRMSTTDMNTRALLFT